MSENKTAYVKGTLVMPEIRASMAVMPPGGRTGQTAAKTTDSSITQVAQQESEQSYTYVSMCLCLAL